MYAPPAHDLQILKQESLAKEKFSRNQVQKEAHVVAKGLPFTIDVASSSLNLSTARLYAKLHYDSDFDEDFKLVDHVKAEPMTYKVFISAGGDRASVETRIFVLTSQHEDSLFRVKVGVIMSTSETLEVTSEPIRVVSKPSQIYKEKRKRAGAVTTVPTSTPLTSIKRKLPESASMFTMNGAGDRVFETLKRMEEQQKEQRKMIENLLVRPPVTEQSNFEALFVQFLEAYKKLPAEERPSKIQTVLSSISPAQSENLTEFVSLCAWPSSVFNQKNLPTSLPFLGDFATESSFGTSNKEMEALDDLYSQLTWSPESEQTFGV